MAKKNKAVSQPLTEEKEVQTNEVPAVEEVASKKSGKKASKKEEKLKNDKKQDKKGKNSKKNKKNKFSIKQKAKETTSELKKVKWPTFGQVVKRTGVVLAVVVIFAVILFGFDALVGFLFGLMKG